VAASQIVTGTRHHIGKDDNAHKAQQKHRQRGKRRQLAAGSQLRANTMLATVTSRGTGAPTARWVKRRTKTHNKDTDNFLVTVAMVP
jgi:hypothetical protein